MFKSRLWQGIGAGLALVVMMAYAAYRYELRPVNTELPDPIAVDISAGEREPAIAQQLQRAGVIRSHWAFTIYVSLHGLRRKIEAGYYELSPADSTVTNAKIIARGIVVNKAFLVKEGATIAEIESQANQDWLRGGDLPTALAANDYSSKYLAQRPVGVTLEGYLFPDTYQIAPQTTPHQLVQSMISNFDSKVTSDLVDAFAAEGLTLHQGLTLASMVEREAQRPADRPVVAQVFLKRLRQGMKLESSVTAIYGAQRAGVNVAGEGQAVGVKSPYNTYMITGLPPGPICNPGMASIQAAAHPANTDYLYFVADKSGVTHFAQTFAEHQANISRYLSQ